MDILQEIGIQKVYQILATKITNWFETFIELLPNLAIALLVIIFFIYASKILGKLFYRVSHKLTTNLALRNILTRFVKFCILLCGLFIALSILQLNKAVTSFLAGAGIIGLALGFAFQDTAANFMSGIIMAFKKPFKVGDIIETNGFMGEIKQIDFRTTTITNFNGQDIIIPNRKVFEEALTNYVANGRRRIDLSVGVSYADDLDKVEEVAKKAMQHLTNVSTKDIEFFYTEFGASSINFRLHLWIDYPNEPSYLLMQSNAIKQLKKAFDANDISIPFPIRTLDFGIKGGKTLQEELSKN